MKIGITYLFTISQYGYPPPLQGDLKALEAMSKMGFHYLEMEGLGEKHTQMVWENRVLYKQKMDDLGIHIHNFCAVDPFLVSMNKDSRLAAYERFKRTAELGIYLGTETFHLASYAPPVNYKGNSPYQLDEEYNIKDTYQLSIPDGFCWERVWDVLVESCKKTAQIAGQSGRTIIMEPRVGDIICSVDSMLRLIKDVDMENFKANFDTGHFSAQRENVILALKKLEGHFANVHISDNNPSSASHTTVGKGSIDWREFFRVIGQMNYQGYLGIDLTQSPTMIDDVLESADYIMTCCQELKLKIEK